MEGTNKKRMANYDQKVVELIKRIHSSNLRDPQETNRVLKDSFNKHNYLGLVREIISECEICQREAICHMGDRRNWVVP
ncbi:hypothetical protein AYI69_g5145 [Smittium culicis]|uniref:Integrase zinc-binding domain-containing protein n=1 Tax=Smittium culicis TaxID=133412 RepID=A0A1R1Y7T3_9FUNG|nr:hypothetical protein AYI69_g5145 [Smittium culicis]